MIEDVEKSRRIYGCSFFLDEEKTVSFFTYLTASLKTLLNGKKKKEKGTIFLDFLFKVRSAEDCSGNRRSVTI